MAGVEVIGVLASIIQIASTLDNTVDTIKKIQKELQQAPSRITERLESLEFLLTVLDLIRKSPELHTSGIQKILDSLQRKVEDLLAVSTINLALLQKHTSPALSFLRGRRSIKAEQSVLTSLDSLEREKSSLLLYLSVTHGINLERLSVHSGMAPSATTTKSPQREIPSELSPPQTHMSMIARPFFAQRRSGANFSDPPSSASGITSGTRTSNTKTIPDFGNHFRGAPIKGRNAHIGEKVTNAFSTYIPWGSNSVEDCGVDVTGDFHLGNNITYRD